MLSCPILRPRACTPHSNATMLAVMARADVQDPLATHEIKPRCMWVVTASMDVQALLCSMYDMSILPLLPQFSKLHVVPGHRADFQSHNNTDHTSPSTLAESEGVRGRSASGTRVRCSPHHRTPREVRGERGLIPCGHALLGGIWVHAEANGGLVLHTSPVGCCGFLTKTVGYVAGVVTRATRPAAAWH